MKRFLTIFLPTERIHLYKDVGMIPYHLAKILGIQCGLAYLNKESKIMDDKYETFVKLLPISYSPYILIKWLNIFKFARDYAKKYDIVNFYHGGKAVLLMALLFKCFNSKCKIYIKMDLNKENFDNLLIKPDNISKQLKKTIHKWVSNKLVDFYSVETKMFYDVLNNIEPYQNKIIYTPNGVFIEESLEANEIDFNEKQNIILTVGRIGTFEKYNELLVQAIANIPREKLVNWKVYFVGPIDNQDFLQYIDKVYSKKDYLKKHFVFTGNISNRKQLYDLYHKAKMFCLTSRWEGFPLVIPEAMYYGNYIITSDFPAAHDLTNFGEVGKIFTTGDKLALQQAIEEILDGKVNLELYCNKSQELSRKNFAWTSIVRRLARELAL